MIGQLHPQARRTDTLFESQSAQLDFQVITQGNAQYWNANNMTGIFTRITFSLLAAGCCFK